MLLSCKGYGPNTAILPLLNGMRQLDVLDARFGRDHVLGGMCAVVTMLQDDGHLATYEARRSREVAAAGKPLPALVIPADLR